MAWLEKRGTSYRLIFRIAGERLAHTIGVVSDGEADFFKEKVERRLRLVKTGDLVVPEGLDVGDFVLGVETQPKIRTAKKATRLGKTVAAYKDAIPPGAMEEESLATAATHLAHFIRLLGASLDLRNLQHGDLQKYVNQRAKEPGSRSTVSPVTIRKEMVTFGGMWAWARRTGLVDVSCPSKGLRYPKADEKAPFQTRSQIERQIELQGLEELQQRGLWECLFLDAAELSEFVSGVENAATAPFLYPMLTVAAHTGARRSELVRSTPSDVDFEAATLTIRERKRDKSQRTTRRVPLSSKALEVLGMWFDSTQPTTATFTHNSRPITKHQATDHFKRTVARTNWNCVRGWHVLRHSFISNCASRGIAQRLIDGWVGHQTEAMRRRYTHLFPSDERKAMNLVFDS